MFSGSSCMARCLDQSINQIIKRLISVLFDRAYLLTVSQLLAAAAARARRSGQPSNLILNSNLSFDDDIRMISTNDGE